MPSRSRRVIRILPVLHFCLILPSQRPPVAKTILSDARYAHDFDESGLDRYNISIFDISVRHLAMFDPDQNASTNDDGSEADRDLCLERGQRDPLCDATTNERRIAPEILFLAIQVDRLGPTYCPPFVHG